WLVVASIGGPYFGRGDEVSSNEQAAYLPSSAEATKLQERVPEFRDSEAIPAIAVFVGAEELSKTALADLRDALADTSDIDCVLEPSPPIPSEYGKAAVAFLPIDADAEVWEVVADVRAAH